MELKCGKKMNSTLICSSFISLIEIVRIQKKKESDLKSYFKR